MELPAHPLLADPFVAAAIERALAPFAAGLGDDELGWMRVRLAEQIAEDRSLLELLDAAYPRAADGSGERAKEWLGVLESVRAGGTHKP